MAQDSTAVASDQAVKMTGARVIAKLLRARGVKRAYGLIGGHIQPIVDEMVRHGIEFVDTRHECAAVYMAHAEAALSGRLTVAMATAGPGITNAVTGLANADVARMPVLVISGRVPRLQDGMGGMQDVPQAEVVRSICRRVEVVWSAAHVAARMDAAIRAALGSDGTPGPAYIDFPTDIQREEIHAADIDEALFAEWAPTPIPASADALDRAAKVIREARRPLVLAGQNAHGCRAQIEAFLEKTGAIYLDTSESRGAIPGDNPANVPAMRAKAMQGADLVLTLGRKLDFQVAYGSPAIFEGGARFIRIGRNDEYISGNRRAEVELKADVALALDGLLERDIRPIDPDAAWLSEIKSQNEIRERKLRETIRSMPAEGLMHPYSVIDAVNAHVDKDTIMIADGGDILSFARVALKDSARLLDPGALGCIGVGVAFANGAAISNPGKRVIALIGDGSFGFGAMEIHTAVRKGAKVIFVVANNKGWNIDRHDQIENYDGHLIGVELGNVEYDLLARALGAYGERVERREDLPAALERAFENAPAVLNVMVDPEPKSPDFASGIAFVYDRQALRRWHELEDERRASEAV
ncbi:thiamine pyrophosphate-binding protein [Hyphomicrobium sp.]|uniref:thiamine pyrophosphate-binding protein n=1 Tax=Hyphomicrobium sp. TaxID=82 RepID=UPI0025B7E7AF|nr:thiamine pyrophosphate-binding protein [Hyphomicrobium sp.]MCC7250498.1 thiamine pyrophosphate-binding protein [Hyphomicrobium sp.]